MEDAASENLQRQGYQIFLPRTRLRKRRRGRWQIVSESLFPGYLFVALDFARDDVSPIRSTTGVKGLVRFGASSPPMPPGSVELLQEAAQGVEGDSPLPFSPGDRVRIARGPFAGLEAVYQMESGQARVHVLLGLLGRMHVVGLDVDNLEAP